MIFCIKADAQFEAEDIVDAFQKLSKHFKTLSDMMEDDEGDQEHDTRLFIGGTIGCSPCRIDTVEPQDESNN